MNKENRKLAQEKRAAERQRKEQQEKTLRTLKFVIPTVIIVALVIWVIADYVSYSSSNKAAETETTTEAAAVTTETGDADTVEDADEGTTLYTGTDVAVEDGDTVNIDYVGTVDGEEFSGGNTQGQGTDLVIGSGSYIDDFEEQLIGHYVCETVDVTVTFPDSYANDESLSGKEAVFETTINGIYK
jgi:trigger factor